MINERVRKTATTKKTAFTNDELEEVYRLAEPIIAAKVRGGAKRIAIDLVSAQVREQHHVGHSNDMRPALARLFHERHPEWKRLIKINNGPGRGPNLPQPTGDRAYTVADLRLSYEMGYNAGIAKGQS